MTCSVSSCMVSSFEKKKALTLWTCQIKSFIIHVNYEIRFHSSISSIVFFIVLGFNDTSILEGNFVPSLREREKKDRRISRGDEREGNDRKRNRNESEETEGKKNIPLPR